MYGWAGKIRVVDIRKNVPGAEYFLVKSKIFTASEYVFGELAKENNLTGLDKEKFVERLAYFYDQVNFIHPFREGNGRTQRVFFSRIAKDVGFEIDWDLIVGEENDKASRLAAEKMDLHLLIEMFNKIVEEA
ncbi:MAG: Fic family protein [Candidatus Nomurabacteria bacterium]|nr:Fic family protein [Candidatus Nomurabacteria bacterium]